MPLDPFKESPLFLHEFGSYSPVQRLPDRVAEEGSNQPAEQGGAEGGDAHGDEGIQWDDLPDPVGHRGGDGDGEAAASKRYEGGDD